MPDSRNPEPASDEQPTAEQTRRLYLSVMYDGPWAKIANWLLALDRNGEIKHEIKTHGLRDRLAAWCELRDHAWRRRHLTKDPADRWRRS